MCKSHYQSNECTQIATVTDDAHMRISWRGKVIVDIERDFLDTNGVLSSVSARPSAARVTHTANAVDNIKDELIKRLASLQSCSRRGLSERFDSTVGANTVLMPFGGKNQITPEKVMAAKVPTGGVTHTGTLMSYGFDPYLSEKSPFHGAMYAVMESLARLACAGGDTKKAKLTFQEYFEKLGRDEKKWGKPLSALLGALKAQKEMQVAAIGGKDSMSGTFNDLSVPPTLCSFAVVPCDMRKVVSGELKAAGDRLVLLKAEYDENGMPDFDTFRKTLSALHKAIDEGKVAAAYTADVNGIAVTVAKMAFGNSLGAKLNMTKDELFCDTPCSIMVEVKDGKGAEIFDLANARNIGEVTGTDYIEMCGEKIALSDALKAFTQTLETVFSTGKHDKTSVEAVSCKERSTKKAAVKIAKPRVLVPIFPGTNCEYESIAAFEREGAIVDSIVIRNTKKGDIEESLSELARLIGNAQIIMLPGGFSSGDEPDGSAKFTATVLRSAQVKDAVHELLNSRDGLMLGICNGFQTLIKLGLVPYGEIRDTSETAPTLTFNRIGRHQSRIVRTRIASVKSPWFCSVNVGDIISVPISHGEGRVVFPDAEELKKLIANGQIATQYVDLDGKPSMDTDFCPPQSTLAVEGLFSPDGRILGKMGHSERHTQGLYTNVEGNYDSGIFRSGVKYFE